MALLSIENVCKRFGPTRALHNVGLELNAGEVLALIGENGAGKSTLLKTLSGALQPDSGRITLNGKPFAPSGPSNSRANGVAMIYQELNLAPDLSVEDNIMIGRPGSDRGLLFRSRQRPQIKRALEMVGLLDLSPTAIVGRLSIATQQLIEVARAIASDAKVILFDEPTSSLPQEDVVRLFKIIDDLRARGIGMIYISHFLEEVRAVADRYAVLRDGESVGAGNIKDITDPQIISLMVGREVDDLYPVVPHEPSDEWVQVKKVQSDVLSDIDFSLRRGEIFGIGGLVGAGRSELVRALAGIDCIDSGTVSVSEQAVRHSVRPRMDAGFGFLSEDRKNEGLGQSMSLTENITISQLKRYSTFGFVNLAKRNQASEELIKRVEVKTRSGHQLVSELSGGNQQKVAIARILHQNSEILLLDEPTKGIDVGTKAEIYRMMGELAAAGKTILFVSSYLPELLAVCDRIGVMARGKLKEIRDVEDWTKEDIMEIAVST